MKKFGYMTSEVTIKFINITNLLVNFIFNIPHSIDCLKC